MANSGIKRLVDLDVVDQYALGAEKTAAKAPSKRTAGATGFPGMSGGGGGPAVPRGRGDSESFTRRTCDKRRDVVHYSFTVIMDPKYLPALQKNLMKQNYHTILDQPSLVQEVPDDTSGYCYGYDPIMKVTIRGELLLLTDWERPLMPKVVLARLRASDALRPEDQKRLTGDTGSGSRLTRNTGR